MMHFPRLEHCALVLGLLTAACSGPGRAPGAPDWLLDPTRHPAADPAVTLSATGSASLGADDPVLKAKQRALAEISSSLSVAVATTIETLDQTLRRNGDLYWSSQVHEVIRLTSVAELPGAEIVARDQDGETLHVLVTVPRDLLVEQLLAPVDHALQLVHAASRLPSEGLTTDGPTAPLEIPPAAVPWWSADRDPFADLDRALARNFGQAPDGSPPGPTEPPGATDTRATADGTSGGDTSIDGSPDRGEDAGAPEHPDHALGRRLARLLTLRTLLDDALGPAFMARVVAPDSPRVRQRTGALEAAGRENTRALAGILAGLSLRVVGGAGQHAPMGGDLPEPLVVELVQDDPAGGTPRPVAGLPVTFTTRPGVRAELAPTDLLTDAAGRLACTVRAVGAAPGEQPAVEARIDVLPGAPPLPVPTAAFRWSVPGPSETRVSVGLVESHGTGPRLAPRVETELAAHLAAAGFDVHTADGATLLGRPPAELAARPEQPQVVLRGTVMAWHTRGEGGLYWFRTQAELELVDVASGHTLPLTLPEVRDAHRAPDAVGARQAFDRLVPVARQALDQAFVSRWDPSLARD